MERNFKVDSKNSFLLKNFENFDVNKVALFNDEKVEALVVNPEIIRHRGKIKAAINNAKLFIAIQNEFGSFSNYMWGFVNHKTIVNHWSNMADYPATTKESDLSLIHI